jgi:polysaccharide export outer membrane protein
MLKKLNSNLGSVTHLGMLALFALGIMSPVPGLSQQSSALVTANVNAGDSGGMKRERQVTPARVTAVPAGFEKLTLAPGYLLGMDIYNTPEMSSQLRIDAKGFVTVPLIGSVHLEGKTVPEAQRTIAQLLVDQQILKDPQVTLNILEFSSRNVSVVGEVQGPGRIELLAPASLEEVLAMAGGETIEAGNEIEVQHPTGDGSVESRHVEYARGGDSTSLQNTLVEPGDTVVVHRAGIIYVLGAVNRPGGYLMVNGGSLSVIQALSLAGGTTLQASDRWALVVRKQASGITQFKVPLARMETGDSAPSQLQPNDALYIPISTWKAVLINGSNVLSAATSAAIYRAP